MAGLNQAEWADFWLEVSLSAGIVKKMQNLFCDQVAYVHLWWNSRIFWFFRLTLFIPGHRYLLIWNMLVFLPQPFWIDWRLHFPFFLVSYFYYMTYYQWSMECILPEGVCWHSCRHIGHVQKESLCWLKEDWGALYSSLLKGRGKPFPSPCVVVVFLLDPIFIPPASDGLYSLTVVDFALNVKICHLTRRCWQIHQILPTACKWGEIFCVF